MTEHETETILRALRHSNSERDRWRGIATLARLRLILERLDRRRLHHYWTQWSCIPEIRAAQERRVTRNKVRIVAVRALIAMIKEEQHVRSETGDLARAVIALVERPKVVYIAHPLNAATREGIERNRQNATLWVMWAATVMNVAPVADWIILTAELEETPENRKRGLEIDVAIAAKCDELWLCGGRVSSGMQIEADAAARAGVVVCDLTHLGALPPLEESHDR